MAPKGSKRASPSTAAVANKKPKLDSMMVAVVDALGHATEIPEDCRAMLEAGVPSCLGPPADERHELQRLVVKMIGETIEGAEARLRHAVDEAGAKVAKAEAAKAEAENALSDAKGILEAKSLDLAASKTARNDATQAVKSARAGLRDAQAVQKKGDASLADAGKVKQEFEGVLREHLGPLKDDDGFDAKIAKTHVTQVMRLAKSIGLDDSLLTALPAACTTMPSRRGSFDKMVVSELESSFQTKVAALVEEMNTGAEATANRAAAVTAAEQVVQAAEDVQKDAEAEFATAQTAKGEAGARLREAEDGSTAKAAEQAAAEELNKKAKQVLENFVGYNMLCFSTLRDKVSKPEEAPAEATAEAAAEVGVQLQSLPKEHPAYHEHLHKLHEEVVTRSCAPDTKRYSFSDTIKDALHTVKTQGVGAAFHEVVDRFKGAAAKSAATPLETAIRTIEKSELFQFVHDHVKTENFPKNINTQDDLQKGLKKMMTDVKDKVWKLVNTPSVVARARESSGAESAPASSPGWKHDVLTAVAKWNTGNVLFEYYPEPVQTFLNTESKMWAVSIVLDVLSAGISAEALGVDIASFGVASLFEEGVMVSWLVLQDAWLVIAFGSIRAVITTAVPEMIPGFSMAPVCSYAVFLKFYEPDFLGLRPFYGIKYLYAEE